MKTSTGVTLVAILGILLCVLFVANDIVKGKPQMQPREFTAVTPISKSQNLINYNRPKPIRTNSKVSNRNTKHECDMKRMYPIGDNVNGQPERIVGYSVQCKNGMVLDVNIQGKVINTYK